MKALLRRIGRGTRILIGLILATYAASYVVSVGFGLAEPGSNTPADILVKSLVIAVPIMIVAGTFAAIPMLIVVAIAEARGWRSLVVHLAAGAAIGTATGLIAAGASGEALGGMLAGVLAGMLGSVVYWAIAGRRAGMLRNPPPGERK